MLPSSLHKGNLSRSLEFSEAASVSHDLKIIGLADAVEGRINVMVNTGQIFRCELRQNPSSSLTNDCITAMAEGLSSNFYNYFLVLLWGDNNSTYLSEASSDVDSEWNSFCSIIMQMGQKPSLISKQHLNSAPDSSWEFLLNSDFHKNYCKFNFIAGISGTKPAVLVPNSSRKEVDGSLILNDSFYSELFMVSLDSLHSLYESLKLDTLRKRDLELLAVLLCNVAKFLGEEYYLDHYIRDFPCLSKKFGMSMDSVSQKNPPSLFKWLENCLEYGYNYANVNDLPPLIRKDESSVVSWARKVVSFYSLLLGAKPIGKKLPSGVFCNIAPGSFCSNEELTVLAMVGENFGLQQLDLLPCGVSLPLRHALDKCRESPPTDWPAAAYILLGREDLALSCLANTCKSKELETQTNVNLISMSTPYMLHLHPVTVPSIVSDTSGLDSTKFEDTDSVDGSMTDGMEHIFASGTQLRYGRDLRLNEVRRVLCSARPVAIQTSVSPSATDQDLQQAQLWHLAQRTTALPLGRGAFTLATINTLLTEAFTVPKLVLAGRLPAQQNATVNLDPNIRNIQELKSWPEFHNAVAAGLRLSPIQGKMSRTWIMYNKPEEPNITHAGLLLALGLHGHLRALTISDIYKYFYQEHESTAVGLMLGLAASYRGTMQPSLYVHIPARHPSSVELEVPTILQGEIGRRSGGDNVLEREGHAVSAGFALGLVALGTSGLERSHFLSLSADEHNRCAGQMMDGTMVNVDVTAPGAIIALSLMFLKTESEAIVSRLSIPNTHFDLQYVRPDFIMLRVIARNLIMWSRVYPSEDWIQSQIPEIVKSNVEALRDDTSDVDEMDAETFVQAYVNIVAGACISLGLRFAGTKNANVQELLYGYAVYFLNEIKPVFATRGNAFLKGLSRYVDRCTLEICLHLVVLSLSVVMAGSGHLQTFRLLRFLRGRNSADGHASYGIQMAVSLAIGFLFLGGGMRTFSTNNNSIAALFISLYPRLPSGPNDNRCHLQAFRHLYVLATEARWIQTVDVDTGLPVYAPFEVTVRETEHYSETSYCEVTPCILPERAILKRVCVCGPRYWPQVIELVPEDKPWWSYGDKNDPFNSGVLYIKRKIGACSYVDDPVGCQSLLSRAMHKVFSLTSDPSTNDKSGLGSVAVDQLVSTFSSDPSLIAFAQLCCDPSWNSRQVYLSLHTMIGSMVDQVINGHVVVGDSLNISNLKLGKCMMSEMDQLVDEKIWITSVAKSISELRTNKSIPTHFSVQLALAYIDAQLSGKLTTSKGGIVQSKFMGSVRKRVEELLNCSNGLQNHFSNYLTSGKWPDDESQGDKNSILLSWYLKWFRVPPPSVIKTAAEKIKPKLVSSSLVPFLRLLFPTTHINAIDEIDKFLSLQVCQ
ncbi:Anaphase-promoting complex subunit 1 [Citrus sinensis]|nr:Anaphase-promoting complex subunit 1 [Citrus sinensis]